MTGMSTLESMRLEREYLRNHMEMITEDDGDGGKKSKVMKELDRRYKKRLGKRIGTLVNSAKDMPDMEAAFVALGLIEGIHPVATPAEHKKAVGLTEYRMSKLIYAHHLQRKIIRRGFSANISKTNDMMAGLDIEIETKKGSRSGQIFIHVTEYRGVDEPYMARELVFEMTPLKHGLMVLSGTAEYINGIGEARGLNKPTANLFTSNIIDLGLESGNLNIKKTGEGEEDGLSTDAHLERYSEKDGTADGLGEVNVPADRQAGGEHPAGPAQGNEGERVRPEGDNSLSDDSPDVDRETRHNALHSDDGTIRPETDTPGTADNRGGGDTDGERTPADSPTEAEIERDDYDSAVREFTLEEKVELQKTANKTVPIEFGSEKNTRESLPFLFPEQQNDIIKTEKRFFEHGEKGICFTNGTGTGKTFTGLGAASRFFRGGKKNILIVCSTATKCKDWQEEAEERLDLPTHILKDTNDMGENITITTYANFRANTAILKRKWDLVIYDESHYLGAANSKDRSSVEDKHRYLTAVNSQALFRARDFSPEQAALNRKIEKRAEILSSEIRRTLEIGSQPDEMYDEEYRAYRKATGNEKVQARIFEQVILRAARKEFRAEQDEIDESLKEPAKELTKNTKVIFLSATPFAYHWSLSYADGYLFNITENVPQVDSGGYNSGDNFDRFYMRNFGYGMKYNKLQLPDKEVDVGMMERRFNQKLIETGALSSRRLEIDQDYSREFVLLDAILGKQIEDGLDKIYNDKDDAGQYKYIELSQLIKAKYNWTYTAQLLEAIKTKYSVERINKHLAMGRKVILFHTYVNSLPSHPFDFRSMLNTTTAGGGTVEDDDMEVLAMTKEEKEAMQAGMEWIQSKMERLLPEIELFEKENPDLVNLDLKGLDNPPNYLQKAFGSRAMQFRGSISKTKKAEAIARFNKKGSGVDVIIVQKQSGKEGISLHDKGGNAQRVVYIMGLPIAPTDAIQIEGRAYRTGNKSNAIFEYPVIHTDLEKRYYGGIIASRASTAENLAMGDTARNLKEAFISGYLFPSDMDPNENQGQGGKESDRALDVTDEFDRAKTFYFSQQKKTSGTKAAEGTDYFATPEPLGLKMVEWAGAKPNDAMLEPSAGHGAIARFFPKNTKNTFVEESNKLASDLSVNASQGAVKDQRFEDLDVINKYDCICMNPPFGTGGKTAIEHLIKATKHLKNGGRIVAILPDGPAMEKRLNQFFESKDAVSVHIAAKISLPACTFERAGTKVKTTVWILDKQNDTDDAPDMIEKTLYSKNIGDFFDDIRGIAIPERKKPSGMDSTRAKVREIEAGEVLDAAESYLKRRSGGKGVSFNEMSDTIAQNTGVGQGITRDILKKRYHVEKQESSGDTALFNEPPRPVVVPEVKKAEPEKKKTDDKELERLKRVYGNPYEEIEEYDPAENDTADGGYQESRVNFSPAAKTETQKDSAITKESVIAEIVKEETATHPDFKEIPAETVKRFSDMGVKVKLNTSDTKLSFSGSQKDAPAFSRILFFQGFKDGKNLFRNKDWLKKNYDAKFHKDDTGKSGFSGAWWHIDAEYLDVLEEIFGRLWEK